MITFNHQKISHMFYPKSVKQELNSRKDEATQKVIINPKTPYNQYNCPCTLSKVIDMPKEQRIQTSVIHSIADIDWHRKLRYSVSYYFTETFQPLLDIYQN